jgi:TonB family protein
MIGFATTLESHVLAYLLNSLWQVPLVLCAALIAARLARRIGPQTEHRVWVGALLLEVVLPLCHFKLNELGRQAWGLVLWLSHGEAVDGHVHVLLDSGAAAPVALPWQTALALAAVAMAYVCALLYFAARLGWGIWTTETLRRRATRLVLDPEMTGKIAAFGFGNGAVQFATSSTISGPATVGVRNQTLLLPPGFLDKLSAEEFDALLAHEIAHMQRQDFVKNLLYGFLALPAVYHPLLWLTRQRLAETRELVCDAMAAEAVGGREGYARSLLRLARMLSDRRAPRILHAIGILDANIFERRVMYLTRKSLETRGAQRVAIAVACALLAIATCTSALALRMEVTEPSTQNPAPPTQTPKKIAVKDTYLNVVTKVPPVYPVDAKTAKITGTVALDAIIGKDGSVENLKVLSGPTELQQSALDAVKQWKYKPFLLNGDPIDVETTIKVIYTLKK